MIEAGLDTLGKEELEERVVDVVDKDEAVEVVDWLEGLFCCFR